MLGFLGTVATAGLIIFVISTLLVFLDVSRQTKIVMAALLSLWVGIATASVNSIVQLLFLPAAPVLALALFAVDLLVIYGLMAYGVRHSRLTRR